jgi:hypothetical protein
MLQRSAADVTPREGETVFSFTIGDDTQETLVRYFASRWKHTAVDAVADYLRTKHPTWRIRQVERVLE